MRPIKPCLQCGDAFSYTPRPRREQKFCRKQCADLHRTKPSQGPCPQCGRAVPHVPGKKKRVYCSRRCSGLSTPHPPRGPHSPETRLKLSRAAKVRSARPEFRLWASNHMRRMNADPSVRAKTTASLKGRTFTHRGGNGQFTPEQTALHLRTSWPMEVSIPTGNPKWKSATVDLAHPTLKIAVECDGASHHTLKQRNRDQMKEIMLVQMGWVVLRFWNSEVTSDLESVVSVLRAAEAHASATCHGLTGKMLNGSMTLR